MSVNRELIKEVSAVLRDVVEALVINGESRLRYSVNGQPGSQVSTSAGSDILVYEKMIEVGLKFINGTMNICCERCLTPRNIIRTRGINLYYPRHFIDDLEIKDLQNPDGGAELVCRSCSLDIYPNLQGNAREWCDCCNLCDALTDSYGNSLSGTFIHTPGESGDEVRCYECHASHLEEFSMCVRGIEVCYDYETPCAICSECGIECTSLTSCEHIEEANGTGGFEEIECDACGGFSSWDCICEENDGMMERVFYDEYENEELPENNSEKAKEIKDVIKNLGEEIYDLQEYISEGKYLKVMDLLQMITNKVNSL